MSRVAKRPITVPAGVELNVVQDQVTIKGSKGTSKVNIHPTVAIIKEKDQVIVKLKNDNELNYAIAGTMRALLSNAIEGVIKGFEKKLTLVGVGYRAQMQGKKLNLTLGFSHPIFYDVPEGITIETPSVTEIVVRGANKQQVGQVAADIRAYRSPEPYKGKGVRYADEVVVIKESDKKK